MKILYIAHANTLSGGSKSLLNIIDEMSKKHEIYVMTSYKKGKFVEELKKRNCHVLHYKYYWRCGRRFCEDGGYKNPRNLRRFTMWHLRQFKWIFFDQIVGEISARRAARQIKELGIDLIHTNTSVIDFGARLNRLTKIPHIWHFREFLEEDMQLYFYTGTDGFHKLVNNYTDKVITISKAIYQKYEKYIDKDKLVMIYNGVPDCKENYPKKNRKEFNLIQAGRIHKCKGTDIAIRAVKELRRRGYKDIHLYIVGDGKMGFCKKDYEQTKSQVHIMGYINNLNEYRQKNIDLELVCSLSEAFGRVTVEAMLCGLPVIGSDSGGTRELIKDGFNGYKFPKKNVKLLADRIEYMYKHPEEMKVLGNNGRQYAKENFMISRCNNEIENLYKNVLK